MFYIIMKVRTKDAYAYPYKWKNRDISFDRIICIRYLAEHNYIYIYIYKKIHLHLYKLDAKYNIAV